MKGKMTIIVGFKFFCLTTCTIIGRLPLSINQIIICLFVYYYCKTWTKAIRIGVLFSVQKKLKLDRMQRWQKHLDDWWRFLFFAKKVTTPVCIVRWHQLWCKSRFIPKVIVYNVSHSSCISHITTENIVTYSYILGRRVFCTV